MGERKVLNKYYPIDFDPALLPKRKQPKNKQYKIRMELPMNVRCDRCGEFMYQGKRFNVRKENAEGEFYHGLQIFRFYMKCVRCSSEFTLKTDLENRGYTCEHGVTRNFEPLREEREAMELERRHRMELEMGDTMTKLEHRTVDSKKEMEDLDILDELRAVSARNSRISFDDVLDQVRNKGIAEKLDAQQQDDDGDDIEAEMQQFRERSRKNQIKRLEDDDDDDDDDNRSSVNLNTNNFSSIVGGSGWRDQVLGTAGRVFVAPAAVTAATATATANANAAAALAASTNDQSQSLDDDNSDKVEAATTTAASASVTSNLLPFSSGTSFASLKKRPLSTTSDDSQTTATTTAAAATNGVAARGGAMGVRGRGRGGLVMVKRRCVSNEPQDQQQQQQQQSTATNNASVPPEPLS